MLRPSFCSWAAGKLSLSPREKNTGRLGLLSARGQQANFLLSPRRKLEGARNGRFFHGQPEKRQKRYLFNHVDVEFIDFEVLEVALGSVAEGLCFEQVRF